MPPDRAKLATPEVLAAYLGISKEQLANDRTKGTGPKFLKWGKNVRYRWADIDTWEDDHKHVATKEYSPER